MKKIFEKKSLVLGLIILALITIGFYCWSGRNGRFVRTGDMTIARMNHAATLLKDGRVLITGGYSADISKLIEIGNLSSAEIYNPEAEKFTKTPDMTEKRKYHTATLLKDGRVLIAGGVNDFGRLDSAEIYNPKTSKFTKTGDMNFVRDGHVAILLSNGKVLIIGGHAKSKESLHPNAKPYDKLFIQHNAELYDPATGKFTLTPEHKGWYAYPTATLLPDGRVLIVGDYNGKVVEIYNPVKNEFVQTGKTTKPFFETTAVLLNNNKVLIAGSAQDNYSDLYNISTGKFEPSKGKLNTIYYNDAGVTSTLLSNGKVLIIGTETRKGTENLYNPQKDIFINTPKMKNAVGNHTATKLNNGDVLITGGMGRLQEHKSKIFQKAELFKY